MTLIGRERLQMTHLRHGVLLASVDLIELASW
jgi:hypothetical protein